MKQIAYVPLYHFRFKYVGLLTSFAGLALFLFKDPRYQLLIYAGSLVIIFSRERNETEFTALARAEVFKSVFGLSLSLAIALCMTEIFSVEFSLQWTPFLVIGLPIFLYMLMFYITLAFKIRVESSQEVIQNLRIHRRFYLFWILITLVVLGLLLIKFLG